METNEKQNEFLHMMNSVSGIANSIAGIILVICSVPISFAIPEFAIIIVSVIYVITLMLFIIKYKNIYHPKFLAALSQSGISGFYLNNKLDYSRIADKLDERIKSEKIKEIRILAYYGHDILKSTEDRIWKALNIGANVRVIIVKNISDFIDAVFELECEVKEPLSEKEKEERKETCVNEHKTALGIIKSFTESAKSAKGKFEYKLFTTQARYALITIDDWAWWTPYQPGIKVKDTTSFILDNSYEPSILSQCIKHFEALWKVLPVPAADTETQSSEQ